MTTYTETQTITHAFRKSGLLGVDETLTAEDLELGQRITRSRVGALQARGVSLWNYSREAVPEELLDPLSDYFAMFMLASAGGPRPSDVDVLTGELILRQIGEQEPTDTVQQADYF